MLHNPLSSLGIAVLSLGITVPAVALPPPEDVPEEVLRTEIITEARSPVDGQPLSAAEYAQLQQEQLTQAPYSQVSPDLRHLIFLLRLRQLLNTVNPL